MKPVKVWAAPGTGTQQSGNGTSVMPGNSREMMTAAERRFPVRIRLSVPSSGFGQH
jgi:hypothetical protein